MNKRVLVVYASKYGATAEIAEEIATNLRSVNLLVDLLPADKVLDLSKYHGVVLGSAVYAGRWRKEAVQFLEQCEQKLSEIPVWIFSSGPTGEGDPVELLKGWRYPDALKSLMERIQPEDIMVFHGDLEREKLTFGEKLIVRGVKAPVGDFRDWETIADWAQSIVETMRDFTPETS